MEIVQGNTLVETPDNPASSVGAGSEFTEENLEANILAQLDLPTDGSTGDVETPATTPVPGEPPAAAETKVEDKKLAEVVDEATAHRLRQDNANLKATLIKLGIEPGSDTAESIRSGLITVDELIKARMPVTPTAAQHAEPTTPQIPLGQKLLKLRDTLNQQGDVTAKTYKENMAAALEVIADVVQANQNINQVMENNDLNNLLNATLTATKEAFRTAVKSVVPEDVRSIGEELFIGATDVAVGTLARNVGREKAFTPEGYRHSASRLAPKFDQFVQSIFKAGQAAAVKAIKSGNPNPTGGPIVNPLPPGVGVNTPAPPANPEKFKMENLNANVDEYMRGTQLQV